MRALMAIVWFAGCAGVGVAGPGTGAVQTGGTRPGVMPLLSELPSDATKRDAVLDSSAQAAGPEQRSGLTSKEQTAETAAATAAAVLGGLFSKTKNVTLGASTPMGDGSGGAPSAPHAPGATGHSRMPLAPNATPFPSSDPADDAPPPPPPPPPPADDPASADLVPWIKVK